jgi:energy-coupling factor transporter transmembrane protein EcfT
MLFNSPVLTAFVFSALIVIFLVLLIVGYFFVDKLTRRRSGPQRWHAQNIYAVGVMFIVGFVALFIFKISGSISWQFFSTGVIVVIVISVVLGIGQFFSLQITVWWTKLRRNVVSKWPESPFKHRLEKNIESDEAYYGVKLYKSEASEVGGQNLTLDASIILIRPDTGNVGKVYERELLSRGYNPQICTERTRILELAASIDPDLIIWYIKGESEFKVSIILERLRSQYSEHERPFIFLLVSTSQDVKRFAGLADKIEQYLISPNDFIDAIEELLQKEQLTNSVS